MFKQFKDLGDNTFNMLYFSMSAILVFLSFFFEIPYLQIISISLIKVAVFTTTSTFALKFLNGINFDVYKEIFEEKNIAASILVAGMLIGLAIVIAVAV